MMISYGNVFFTGGEKQLCLPLLNLVSGSQLYLNEDGMFQPIASFNSDPVVGICLNPIYNRQERHHEYWDVTLLYEPHENIDVLKFVVGRRHAALIYIKDGIQHIMHSVGDPDILSEFCQQLRRLDEPSAQQLDTEISLLNDHERHYLSIIIQDDISVPYRYFQQLKDRYNNAKDLIDDINTEFDVMSHDESQLLRLARQMNQFNHLQIVKIIGLGYWTLFEYILDHPNCSHSVRKDVVYLLLKEQQDLVANIPEHLILALYNWRNTSTTNQWVNALNNVGRYQTAMVVATAPFESSRLRIVQV